MTFKVLPEIYSFHVARGCICFRTGCNALHHAINGGNLRVVLYILDRTGRELINSKDEAGWTPLMRAGNAKIYIETSFC